jgi:hypothetical protein
MKFLKQKTKLSIAADEAIGAVTRLRAGCISPLDETIQTLGRMGDLLIVQPEREAAAVAEIKKFAASINRAAASLDFSATAAAVRQLENLMKKGLV